MTDETTEGGAADDESVRTRTRTRTREAPGNETDGEERTEERRRSSRRRRGGRRRRRRQDDAPKADGGTTETVSEADSAADADAADEDQQREVPRGGTRLAAKRQRRDGRRGRRRRGAPLPDEARQAMLVGAPRTMLVTSDGEKTQIVVLEDRTVAEHYVTRKEDVSYVGNIHLGRVQNVLPGMEAAFLDIGKGRNGILYAGEVLYDELDVEDGEHRIESALEPGQTVLVQVTKDPMGTKGARLTMQLSLAGRYLVLAPSDDVFGISRKLPDEERDRLRAILRKIRPEGAGLIVRTAAVNATEAQLKDDLERLVERWEAVQKRAEEAKPLDAVYEEPDLAVRVVRDHFGPEFDRLVVDDPEVHADLKTYLGDVMPEALDKLELYETGEGDDTLPPLFEAHHVWEQLRKAMERKVWLPSGGYLIIDKTEALTVVDVNTGKFTGQSSLEETVLKTNLEAAEEVVAQLRLRDIGGMVIIDFIDMLLPSNQEQVVQRLKRELLRDRTKTRVSEVSKLGLVQMTRKNVSAGLMEIYGERCPECDGRGMKIHLDH
ncbi:MAG: Rne/Rng family ribonuclease [Nitriliruptorales bacterium]